MVSYLLYSSDAAQALLQVAEKDRRLAHGVKQEYAKSFMTKAKSLSGGYRDNDPPKVYYKRKGLVPPDRMVSRIVFKQRILFAVKSAIKVWVTNNCELLKLNKNLIIVWL